METKKIQILFVPTYNFSLRTAIYWIIDNKFSLNTQKINMTEDCKYFIFEQYRRNKDKEYKTVDYDFEQGIKAKVEV